MLEVKNISKVYNTGQIKFKALDNVSLVIEQGDFVAIMGPSGSGKSTLMHILGFLDNPDQGEYLVAGKDTAQLADDDYAKLRKEWIGFVFQQFFLLAKMSALQNIALPQIYSGVKTLKVPLEMMKAVGLQTKTKNLPSELSGGEKQRVAIARALVNNPLIIMADEPTGNLDSKSEEEIMKIFKQLNKEGKTIIMVTHEESLGNQANRVIRLKDGKIVSDIRNAKLENIDETQQQQKVKDVYNIWQFLDYIKQSYQMIFANKVRSLLSMLGIMIGVSTVVAMLALGAGAKASITESLSSLGTNMISVFPDGHNGVPALHLTLGDVDAIAKLKIVKRISPQVNGAVFLIAGNKNLSSSVQGTSSEAANMRNNKPAFGRFYTENEVKNRERVVVIGKTVAEELFGKENPLNKTIKLNRISFRVIGVLPALGAQGFRDRDNTVMIPISTAMNRLLGKDYYDMLDVEIISPELVSEAQDELENLIVKKHNLTEAQKESFRIVNMAEIQNTFQKTASSLSLLLGFIASLSLLVGGIGIMNIMLVSVTERTREIGLRKAIGARKKDILWQFVTESVIMTVTGGILGILFGASIALLLTKLAGWTVKITLSSIIISTSFSIGIGLIFGIWPAKKAAELHPIEALRYE